MNDNQIYKQTLRMVGFIFLTIALCRFSKGFLAPVIMLAGVWCAFSSKLGWSLIFYLLMPFLVVFNNTLLPKTSVLSICMRIGPLLMGVILAMLASSRRGKHRLPLGMIAPFIVAAALGSMTGWAPMVSYMKLINFVLFFLGIWLGTQNLQHRPKDVFLLRSFLLALVVIIIFGSYLVMPFPGISYATSLGNAMQEGGAEYASDLYRIMQQEGKRALFCGITMHSQALAPLVAICFTWALCDMLFIERRFRAPHVWLVVGALPLLYLTRSRVALLSLATALSVVFFYTSHKVQVPPNVRAKLSQGMLLFAGALFLAAVGMQISGGKMSQWIRKTSDVSGDRRSLAESFTESRAGLIRYSMYEFRRNPMFGSGFQVADYTRDMLKGGKGLIITAPIEKGVLPVMVLGETGIVGITCFAAFLLAFFAGCSSRGYYITMTVFIVFLATNMGEATFFSPGGMGGIMLMICTIGGFTLDTTIIYRRELERQWRMAAMMAPPPMDPRPRRA